MGPMLQTARGVVATDLDFIIDRARDEFLEMAGSSLLVAGGAGFLGYYLVQAVLSWNQKSPESAIRLTVADNFSRGMPTWLEELRGETNFHVVRHDVTRPLSGDVGNFQYLVHAASIASPTYYRRCPIETMDANVNGLRHMLDYCRIRRSSSEPVRGMLFYSSSEIYGDATPENIPTPETYRGNVSCTGPRACYDESKRYGETLCVNFAEQHGVPVKMARPFNNFGPGLKITDRRVIPDFARDILAGRNITMLSDGLPRRTYCYVADAIVGYYKILVKGRPGQPYNIGVEGPEISVAELAERLVQLARGLFGYQGRVVSHTSEDRDYLVDNPNRRCPSIAKARAEIGYDPAIGLDEGLRRSLIWYAGNPEAEEA